MPFGLNARQQNAWMYEGGGLALMRDFFKDYGIIPFPAGNTGAQMAGFGKLDAKPATAVAPATAPPRNFRRSMFPPVESRCRSRRSR